MSLPRVFVTAGESTIYWKQRKRGRRKWLRNETKMHTYVRQQFPKLSYLYHTSDVHNIIYSYSNGVRIRGLFYANSKTRCLRCVSNVLALNRNFSFYTRKTFLINSLISFANIWYFFVIWDHLDSISKSTFQRNWSFRVYLMYSSDFQ